MSGKIHNSIDCLDEFTKIKIEHDLWFASFPM